MSAPLVPGAGAALILPLAPGQLPRIPPIQSTFFETGDGIRLISQAGTLEVTVQLVYEPLPIEEVEPSGPHLTLLHAFDLDVFDHRARKHTPRLLRPWILEVPISSLPQAPVDPERLLIARWEDESGWIPLVTNYHRDSDLLVVGILQPGRYAVLQDSLVTLP